MHQTLVHVFAQFMDTNDRGMSSVRQPHGLDMGRTEQLTVLQPQGFVLPDQIPTVEVPG